MNSKYSFWKENNTRNKSNNFMHNKYYNNRSVNLT